MSTPAAERGAQPTATATVPARDSAVPGGASHPTAGTVLAALVPAAIVLMCHLVLAGFAGRVDLFGTPAVYKMIMNLAVLGRFFGLFAAVILVWGALRSQQAPRWVLALAVMSGPVMYSITAITDLLPIFPWGQAAYYGLNPLFVAGLGSQSAMAAVAESLWRWSMRSRAETPLPIITWRLLAVALIGWAVLFFAVLFRGGVAYFFIYQQGYLFLFT